MASCTFGAASRPSQTRSRTNKRFWGWTWPACMKPRVFLAHRQGFPWFTSPHLSFMKLRKSRRHGQALAKVVGSDLQGLSGNGVPYHEGGTEDKGQSLLAVKAKKHPRSTGGHRLGH